jgi:uncharacterized protein YdcH (DUF465 family)
MGGEAMSVIAGEAELREQLWQNNEEYRRLATEHRTYSEELDRLQSRHLLNEEERLQEITLKKKKLLLKDQMYTMIQKYRKEMQTGEPERV